MSFIAKDFIFAGIPSEMFNIHLGDIGSSGGGGGELSVDSSNNVTALTQKIYRNPVPLYFGVEQIPVLSLNLSMYVEGEGLDSQSYSQVSSWLFGANTYQTLRLCQNDLMDTFFLCLLINPKITKVGNYIRGIECTALCNAPWGWKNPKTSLYSWADIQTITDTINYHNSSANNYYTYPSSLILTANSFGGSISIINTSDNNRQFLLTVSGGEVVTMNCQTQTISSTIETYPIQNFNMKFLRFKKGLNVLTVSGNVLSISITSEIASKVG
jgi:phage-related protein